MGMSINYLACQGGIPLDYPTIGFDGWGQLLIGLTD